MERGLFSVALYWGLRQYCGLWRMRQWKKAQKRWKALHPRPRWGYHCGICGSLINKGKFTLDHIIPVDAIFTYQLDPSLLFDPSNLQAAHEKCNSKKGSKYTLPSDIIVPMEATTKNPITIVKRDNHISPVFAD